MSGPKCVDKRSFHINCLNTAADSIVRHLNGKMVKTTHNAITVAKTNLDSVVSRAKSIRNQDVMERVDTQNLQNKLNENKGELKVDVSQWRMAEIPLELGEKIGKSKAEGQQLTVLQQFEIDPLENGEKGCMLLAEAENEKGEKSLHVVLDDKYINDDGTFKDEQIELKFNAMMEDLMLAHQALDGNLSEDIDPTGNMEGLDLLGLMADAREAQELEIVSVPKVEAEEQVNQEEAQVNGIQNWMTKS